MTVSERSPTPTGLRHRSGASSTAPDDVSSDGENIADAARHGFCGPVDLKLVQEAEPLIQMIVDYHEKYRELRLKRFCELAKAYGVAGPKGDYEGFWSDPFCKSDFSKKNLGSALPRLFVAILFFATGAYLNCISQAWLEQNIAGYYEKLCAGPLADDDKALWDVTFKMLPKVRSTKPADCFAALGPIILVVRFVLIPGPLSLRWTIARRWLTIWGMVWFTRSLTIIVTPLPNPDRSCEPIITWPNNIFMEALWIMLGQDLTCQDVMFSGHTVALTLPMMFLFQYIPITPWSSFGLSRSWLSLNSFVRMVGYAIILIGYYFIAGSRFHYTLDVLVGALVVVTMFSAYHNRIELTWLRKQHGGQDFLDRILEWLEQDAKDMHMMKLRMEQHQGASQERWLDYN
mmetsp:Transcript_52562/g.112090  ORF Transcript_52562/g.112090 Transcript_52562/m.112090 type:complete len:402 (+) Transcript_52562:159-1364(+)|eukprot:CAMPEP_0206463588 /NCGR_PEP_ID=MMETSP0324_2-20121206/26695_1 /ASSEMBLY_ACC=CAM_ASM_000836 /TAXON_ID=2866 /ORGANISM="Crypthecodinium cohnii, Strain Seligo" /LENGTH=401 /DNA_ID=CAMNT_0053936027 /DNA_START=157 /DNA_END=1362 /DNA_ORIENTATION=+